MWYLNACARPRSTVSNVSDSRYVSHCRSRVCELDPGSVPYFRGDWSWNNFYSHSTPFHCFKKGWCQLQAKVCARSFGYRLVKLVVRRTDCPDMTISVVSSIKTNPTILMNVRSTAECWEHSAILLTCIKRLSVSKTNFWSSFGWPLKTYFTVVAFHAISKCASTQDFGTYLVLGKSLQ